MLQQLRPNSKMYPLGLFGGPEQFSDRREQEVVAAVTCVRYLKQGGGPVCVPDTGRVKNRQKKTRTLTFSS